MEEYVSYPDALMTDEPVLCGRARYPLHLVDVELWDGRDGWDGNVRYGRPRNGHDEHDGPRRDGNGNGISVRNDDAKPIWVFWNGKSLGVCELMAARLWLLIRFMLLCTYLQIQLLYLLHC